PLPPPAAESGPAPSLSSQLPPATRDPAPIHDPDFEATSCPISDISSINIPCLSQAGEVVEGLGEPLLSDQLLSFPMTKTCHATALVTANDKTGDNGEKTEAEDPTTKNLYEGLLLDKVNVRGEEVLLAHAGQDWGYFESFISESKMELLDLCSKTDLSVNLFSEDDVDNLFDDDDEDSALSSDMCSLKIRYESFQDNMREKTNVLQEDTQFNFFPSVLVNCAKREDGGGGGGRGRRTGEEGKAEELSLVVREEGGKVGDEGGGVSPLDGSQGDDSSCTSSDTLHEAQLEAQTGQRRGRGGGGGSAHRGSRRLLSPSNPLNYGLRSKRKVHYSDDYLYDIDSIDSHEKTERIATEKREKVPAGQREEDVDWCPKKRWKFSRKDLPIIKYIIVNRFKGQRHMSVNLGRLDPAGDAAVSLDATTESHYSSLSPLKDFWQERRREREEQHLNRRRHRHRPFSSMHPKRKYKIANRLCVQRIPQTGEGSAAAQDSGSTPSVSDQAVTTEEGGLGRATLEPQNITHTGTTKRSRTQEREERDGRRRGGEKTGRIRKFKSQARLSSNKTMKEGGAGGRAEGGSVMNGVADACTAADAGVLTSVREADISSNTPLFSSLDPTADISSSCASDQAVLSGEREEGVSVIPGGYLQTLLDASDSSRGAGITYYLQQPPSQQNYPLGSGSDYSQQGPETDRLLYEKSYLVDGDGMGLQPGLRVELQERQSGVCLGQVQYQRGSLCSDHDCLISYDSVGSLSACSSNYSSQSLQSCSCGEQREGGGETEESRDSYLQHCSPTVLFQQSLENMGHPITPLRESSDLLDISNFTPDKFRHSSLLPPETPNLSLQVTGWEMRTGGNAPEYQDHVTGCDISREAKWNCDIMQQAELHGVEGRQIQIHPSFNGEEQGG
uniref:Neurite extension and migration factor b n=1 Tax=Hucho hucho TaxID=62062 RepID=A0A4W5KLG4_9TELE